MIQPAYWTEEDWETADTGWPTDGVILCEISPPDKAMATFKECRKPVVAVGINPPTDVDHVRVDVWPALLQAMRHLAAHGVQRGGRVAFLSPWEADIAANVTDPRYLAYREVMEEANLLRRSDPDAGS